MTFLSTLDSGTSLLLLLFVILFGGMLLFKLFFSIRDFCDELDLINKEIVRTTGREREHWKRRRLQLWLSWLPFYRYRP